jgi:hypothetical protein
MKTSKSMQRRDRSNNKETTSRHKSYAGGVYLPEHTLYEPRSDYVSPLSEDITQAERYLRGTYADRGCSEQGILISTSCLACPLSVCKYDDHEVVVQWLQGRRALTTESKEFYNGNTQRVKELAVEKGVSERTIWRRLALGRELDKKEE